MRKILKVLPALLLVGAILLNPPVKEAPKQEASTAPVLYKMVDPGTGSG
ncbi:hypothetical protein [Bacillus cereus]